MKPERWRIFLLRLPGARRLAGLLILLFFTGALMAEEKEPARLKISGYGFFGNLALKNLLKTFDEKLKTREFFDANYIEDTALVLISRINSDGYLRPKITTRVTLADGSIQTYEWEETIRDPLPRPTEARQVEFRIEKGVFYFYGEIQFEGLHAIGTDDANSFFVKRGALVKFKKGRIFTPARLTRGMSSLTDILSRRGYEQAEATAGRIDQDDATGAVNVTIKVSEGPKHLVRSIREEFFYGTNPQPATVTTIRTNATFSRLWQQDFVQSLRATNFSRGYPDTTVEMAPLEREPADGMIFLDLTARVRSGEKTTLSGVSFTGQEKTKEAVLRRRVRLKKNRALDKIEVENGRNRLARLGIFESVGVRYDQVDEQTRRVIYELKEGKDVDVSMLFGFGTYELLRLGFEVDQYNIWGRAHRAKLRLTQSFKSSSADYLYTMPELVGEDVDVFFNAFGLRREEVSFTREEYGGGVGARKFFNAITSDVGVRYNYQILHATETKLAEQVGPADAAVGSVIFDLKHDRRDSPLYPQRGYKIAASFEVASEYLASEVNFQRFEADASVHVPLRDTTWLHLGASHGIAFTQGSPLHELPFNKRFFPGGANSVRGFQEGEAAPRNEDGDVIGAETFLTGNVELEQALTEKWSVVLFSDSIGFAKSLENYPFDETLFTVGLGIRWRTVVGPIRLEYGHNLNPREHDPDGTLQFSIGFPF